MRFPVLVSYAYAKNSIDNFLRIATHPCINLFLDSGAFTVKHTSKKITLDEYCEFLDIYKDFIDNYIALDVIGNQSATEDNLNVMLAAGYKPVPVHIVGDDERRMDYLFSLSDYVALASIRNATGKSFKTTHNAYVKMKMKWAKGRKVHWLGYSRPEMLAAFRPYSSDASTWKNGIVYGYLQLYRGSGRWLNTTYKNRRTIFKYRDVPRLIFDLGFTTKDINDEWTTRDGRRSPLLECNVDSAVRHSIELFERFNVRYFLVFATNDERQVNSIIEAVERHAGKLSIDLTDDVSYDLASKHPNAVGVR